MSAIQLAILRWALDVPEQIVPIPLVLYHKNGEVFFLSLPFHVVTSFVVHEFSHFVWRHTKVPSLFDGVS